MTCSRIRRGASILLAGFLAALSPSMTRAEALPPYGGRTPDMVRPDTPLPVLFMLYQSMAQAQAAAPQRVTCPRHTKPRVDCTPVVQR